MKNLLIKFKCKLFGHKWRIFYIYGIRAHAKCDRCDIRTDDYIDKFVKVV